MLTKEVVVKGFLLVLPNKSSKLKDMQTWVQKGDIASLNKIEEHQLQNAISYDYFAANWTPLSTVLKKLPEVEDPSVFATRRYHEFTDSVKHHYLLHISDYVAVGTPEPYELAKDKIANILRTRMKAEYISQLETDLYSDAVKKGYIKILATEENITQNDSLLH